MRRNRIRRFFQQKQYAIASLVLFIAIAAMTGVYLSNRITGQKQEEKMAQEQEELNSFMDETNDYAILPDSNPAESNSGAGEDEDVTSVTSVIRPRETKPETTADTETDKESQTEQETKPEQAKNTSAQSDENQKPASDEQAEPDKSGNEGQKQGTTTTANTSALHFSPETDLGWPLQGDVIMNYSMDQTIYFATLEQYKYNPALVIAGKVNDPVKAAATGRITDISTNEETGVTVTMELGDGYTAVYGQLKEVLYKEGATVDAGNAIGYIAEPTKYYSVEGSNLYFELLKDDKPVNPMQYME